MLDQNILKEVISIENQYSKTSFNTFEEIMKKDNPI